MSGLFGRLSEKHGKKVVFTLVLVLGLSLSLLVTLILFSLRYGYATLFWATAVAGSPGPLSAGVGIKLGYYFFPIALCTCIAADILPDLFYLSIGKVGRIILNNHPQYGFLEKYGYVIGLTQERMSTFENKFNNNKFETIVIIKFTPAISGPAFIAIGGRTGIRYQDFLIISLLVSIPRNLCFIGLGFSLGAAYLHLFENHEIFGVGAIFILGLALAFIGGRLQKYVGKKIRIWSARKKRQQIE